MNERTLYFSEFVRFLVKKRTFLLKVGAVCFVATFAGLLVFSRPHFVARATFVAAKNQNVQGDSFQSLLKKFSILNEDVTAISVMRSKTLLKKVRPELDPEKMQKALKIKKSRLDPSLLLLSYKAKDRSEAILILDGIMSAYQNHLREEKQSIAKEQMLFLEKRLEDLESEFDATLNASSVALSDSLGIKNETALLVKSKGKYIDEKREVEQEIKRLQGGELAPSEEFEEVDHQTACMLMKKYGEEIERIDLQIKKMSTPSFEMDSFGDETTARLIGKGVEIQEKLAGGEVTQKEHARFEVELDTQKSLLKKHVAKKILILEEERRHLELKLAKARQRVLDHLFKEKEFVDHKLIEIQEKIAKNAERWRIENKLQLKKELAMQILEGLTQFSESNGLSNHLFHVASKPLDPADAPFKPQPRNFLIFSAMGALLGMFFAFAVLSLRGLPISKEFLRDHKVDVAKNKLEALRLIAARAKKGDKLALIGEKWDENLLDGLDVFKSPSPKAPESIDALASCDQFLIELGDEKPEDLVPYLGKRVICVLKEF